MSKYVRICRQFVRVCIVGGFLDLDAYSMGLGMDFLKDGQISSFCLDQPEGKLLTSIMLHKFTQSL